MFILKYLETYLYIFICILNANKLVTELNF